MPDTIKDGKGTGYLAEVDSNGRLHTHSRTTDEATSISQKEQELYSWTTNHDVGANEYVLCIRNNNTDKHLCIETVRSSNDTATNLSVGFGTWSTVGGGAAVVGANANAGSGNVAQVTCHITATNFTPDATPLLQSVVGANTERVYRPEGKILLGYNDVFYVKTTAASTSNCSAVIWGYFTEVH